VLAERVTAAQAAYTCLDETGSGLFLRNKSCPLFRIRNDLAIWVCFSEKSGKSLDEQTGEYRLLFPICETL